MLNNSFLHIPGFAIDKEEELWASGVTTWTQAINSDRLDSKQVRFLERSTQALNERDSIFFNERFTAKER
ncbi:MAG: hypothetical protein NZ961_25170, partial [Candidatus Poribacteria bacterium]|nr:hypothetical protein [Candidatus Poribacteria bacterium]